jgi:hypothetical protein
MMTTIGSTTIDGTRIGSFGMMTVSLIATERRRSRFGAIYSTLIDVYFVSFRMQYIKFTHASLGNLAEHFVETHHGKPLFPARKPRKYIR